MPYLFIFATPFSPSRLPCGVELRSHGQFARTRRRFHLSGITLYTTDPNAGTGYREIGTEGDPSIAFRKSASMLDCPRHFFIFAANLLENKLGYDWG